MRNFFMLALIAAAGAAAYWIGKQMPDEAIMSFVGVMCGIVASIPISIGLLILLTRDRSAYVTSKTHEDAPQVVETYAEHWTVSTPPPAQLPAPTRRQIDA